MIAFGAHYSKACQYGDIIIISTAGALRIGVVRDPSVRPLIAFEYLSLYIQKYLGQSVALSGILCKGRSCQTKVRPGITGHSQVREAPA